jgi:hypothetical protein
MTNNPNTAWQGQGQCHQHLCNCDFCRGFRAGQAEIQARMTQQMWGQQGNPNCHNNQPYGGWPQN